MHANLCRSLQVNAVQQLLISDTECTGWFQNHSDLTLCHAMNEYSLHSMNSERRTTVSCDANTTARFESDLDLIRRAQQGDSDAFASLFHAHKARIYSVCLRMTN